MGVNLEKVCTHAIPHVNIQGASPRFFARVSKILTFKSFSLDNDSNRSANYKHCKDEDPTGTTHS